MTKPLCRNGLHARPAKGRCRPCRLASNRRAVDRYRITAKGVLSKLNHEATRRGTR